MWNYPNHNDFVFGDPNSVSVCNESCSLQTRRFQVILKTVDPMFPNTMCVMGTTGYRDV